MRAYGRLREKSNQILLGDQTILEEKFYRVGHATFPGQLFSDTNADARSVCGS